MTQTARIRNRGRRPVLVGVDGSVSGQGALAWAAAAASSRRRPLQIVHTFTVPMLGSAVELADLGRTPLELRSEADWILAEAETYARVIARDIKLVPQLFIAGAAPTLLSQAQQAELVVVGSRGLGGFRGLLLGSVSSAVAAHAPCPVVVVRPHRDGTAFPSAPTGRVVVGVDGSEVSTAAIRFAYQEAVRRHVGVTAIHAAMPTGRNATVHHPADIVEQVEQQLFAEAMATRRFLPPGLDLEVKVVHDHPAQALIETSDTADLIVVGSRGHGGFTGMLLGSVSQAVLQHATCPVAVVHRRPTRTAEPLPVPGRRLEIAAAAGRPHKPALTPAPSNAAELR